MRDPVHIVTDESHEMRFLRGLSLAKNWAKIKTLGGLTDSESKARQRMRKAGFAEYRHGFWRVTEAGREALVRNSAEPIGRKEGGSNGCSS